MRQARTRLPENMDLRLYSIITYKHLPRTVLFRADFHRDGGHALDSLDCPIKSRLALFGRIFLSTWHKHLVLTVIDRSAAILLAPLIFWILLNGMDDLIIEIAWFLLPRQKPGPGVFREAGEEAGPGRRMAIFVPLWKEYRVIERMVAQNVGSIRYQNYDMFIGVYPNDASTLAAVAEARKRFPNVHLAQVPHDGPTSKADCLNWIYQRMLLFEEETGARFEMVLTHDAEDVIHPEALNCIDRHAGQYDMVQIPVLALPTPWWEFTHGVYCDDFAQVELFDMPVRQSMGGFIPSNGVGTAYSRRILERLAIAYRNRIFEPACLTEDYENGFRVDWMGGRQIFVRLGPPGTPLLATREYFPRAFQAAVRQRTRWITGIALQSWELHSLWETAGQLYWFWRDRKYLICNLVSPFANIVTLYGIIRGGLPIHAFAEHAVLATALLMCINTGIRISCSARVYGWIFASAVPLRMLWGNWINGLATVMAIHTYATAKLQGRPLRWIKTEHAYPNRAALMEHHRPLEEILTGWGYLDPAILNAALSSKPADRPLAAHLLKSGAISEKHLYAAISLEQNLPLGKPEEVKASVTRSFPAEVSRRWQVLPFKVAAGSLHVAGPEPPTEAMHEELSAFSSMEIRFQLVTPTEFEELTKEYLPELQRNG
jgi:bacteriophage N4 adsorption protein B